MAWKRRADLDPSLWACLRHPRTTLRAFDAARPSLHRLPWRAWSALVAIAFGGSAIYGASLSRAFPTWRPWSGAVWLAGSAGAGWCVFGPALLVMTRRNPFSCAHACLVTMAYGEGVLVTGATINLLMARTRWLVPPRTFNLAWVGLSNMVMATALARQLAALGVPAWKTTLLWMTVLNGSGALFFAVFRRLLQGDR